MNSCTAALHLAVEALGLKAGEAVVVPTMTFAATAEVVRYLGAIPLLVDCDPVTLNLDFEDAQRKLDALRGGTFRGARPGRNARGGYHAGPRRRPDARRRAAAGASPTVTACGSSRTRRTPFRPPGGPIDPRRGSAAGENTAAISCFSFYANKTITTGEGGMATTANEELAERMRLMSLHGLSQDAWKRLLGRREAGIIGSSLRASSTT